MTKAILSEVSADTALAESSDISRDVLREIHHQVKNNLQVVCSLLRIQARGIAQPDAKAVFKRSEERIQSMALVYDTLYRGALLEAVEVHQYLPEMARQLVQGAGSPVGALTVECLVDDFLVSSKVATHLGLLVNEAISHRLRELSAMGLSLPLRIKLERHDASVVLTLEDEGPPVAESPAVAAVERQILDALVRQLEGRCESRQGASFCLQVSMPLAALGLGVEPSV